MHAPSLSTLLDECVQFEDTGAWTPPPQQAADDSTKRIPSSSRRLDRRSSHHQGSVGTPRPDVVDLAADSPPKAAPTSKAEQQGQQQQQSCSNVVVSRAGQDQAPAQAATQGEAQQQVATQREGTPVTSPGRSSHPRSAPRSAGERGGTKRSVQGVRSDRQPASAGPGALPGSSQKAKRVKLDSPLAQQAQQAHAESKLQPAHASSVPQELHASCRAQQVRARSAAPAASQSSTEALLGRNCSGGGAGQGEECSTPFVMTEQEEEPILSATQMTVVECALPRGGGSRAVSSRPQAAPAEQEPAHGSLPEPVQTAPDDAPAVDYRHRNRPQQRGQQGTGNEPANSRDSAVACSPARVGDAAACNPHSSKLAAPEDACEEGTAEQAGSLAEGDGEEPESTAAGPSSPQWQQCKRVVNRKVHAPAVGAQPAQAAAAAATHCVMPHATAAPANAGGSRACAGMEQAAPEQKRLQWPPQHVERGCAMEEAAKGKWKQRQQRGNGTVPGARPLQASLAL